jgi:hypothetical protein
LYFFTTSLTKFLEDIPISTCFRNSEKHKL